MTACPNILIGLTYHFRQDIMPSNIDSSAVLTPLDITLFLLKLLGLLYKFNFPL